MPLSDGYGVVVGTLSDHFIDDPDNEGNWPHYHIEVDTPEGRYDCVINLKSKTDVKVQYRDFRNVDSAYFQNILQLPDGFHSLSSSPTTGALDHLRHSGLKDPLSSCRVRWPFLWPRIWRRRRCSCTRWWKENGVNLIQLMKFYLEHVERIYVFGEPYSSGLGVHNVHMNQGDPVSSQFSAENGIWQDGGVIYQYSAPEPRLSVMLTKFETQSFVTDDSGHPL